MTRLLLRLLLAGGLGLATIVMLPSAAEAHALVVRSDPAAGTSLEQVPPAVTITFSEAPDRRVSTIVVLDAAGHEVSRGPVRPVAGSAFELRVPIGPLLNGVYTVRWKTISIDDGHASGGDFTFGVGTTAYATGGGPAPALASPPAAASPLVVAGHWVFYAGLGLLVGGAWISLFALRAGRRLLLVTLAGTLAMLAGLVLYCLAQARADGTPLGDLPFTSLGLGLLLQALPGLAAAGCVEVALWRGGRTRARALALATLLAALTILVHVLTTHAAAGHNVWLAVALQWAHLAAFAAWIGGLAALLIAIGSGPSPERAAAVRRFSQVAAVSLVVVGLTGLLRAVDEVAAWDALVSTLFGQLVAVKIGLLVVLAGLGAVNRFRSVPAAERSLRGLRRVGGLEVGAAAVVLVASAMLTSLVPPSLARVAARQPPPPRVTASGTAGAVRATLEVTPGYPGLNRFTLRAYDASNRAVLGAVTLRFQMPGRPEVEASTLTLARGADGSYGGLGSNLSLFGEYAVTASVDQRSQPLEVPFQVTTTLSPAQLRQMTMGGAPMVHGLALSNGWRLEAYLTPGHEGRNTLHVNLTDRRGGPVTVNTTPAVTARRGGAAKTLSLLRLAYGTPSANQFYAAGVFTAGTWDFQVSLDAPDGVRVQARFSLTVER